MVILNWLNFGLSFSVKGISKSGVRRRRSTGLRVYWYGMVWYGRGMYVFCVFADRKLLS